MNGKLIGMKIKTFCRIRDIYKAIANYEEQFQQTNGLSLNEGMLLCSLSKREELTSGQLAEELSLTNSNTSKVIKSVEQKGLIRRTFGTEDKRNMYFMLTEEGTQMLEKIKCSEVELPKVLKELEEGRS